MTDQKSRTPDILTQNPNSVALVTWTGLAPMCLDFVQTRFKKQANLINNNELFVARSVDFKHNK